VVGRRITPRLSCCAAPTHVSSLSPKAITLMLPVSALQSMRVMFATPCYISAVTMNYGASVFSLALDSKDMGLPCILHLHSESLITRGRNKIVIKFLSEEFTHLFWIDSDIAFATQSCSACCAQTATSPRASIP
jgi:hypothetical protein